MDNNRLNGAIKVISQLAVTVLMTVYLILLFLVFAFEVVPQLEA